MILSSSAIVLVLFLVPSSFILITAEESEINSEQIPPQTNNISVEEDSSQIILPEPLKTLNQIGGLAQWAIVIVLSLTAIVIIIQIRNQTKVNRGQNYLKMIGLLNDIHFLESLEELKRINKVNPNLLQKSDSQLPIKLKKQFSKVRNTYQAIGSMIYDRMVNDFLFLFAYSLDVKDSWLMLKENVEKTNEEIKKEQLSEETYFVFFRYIREMSLFWRCLSPHTRLFLRDLNIFSVNPNSFLFVSITFILKLLRKDTPWWDR